VWRCIPKGLRLGVSRFCLPSISIIGLEAWHGESMQRFIIATALALSVSGAVGVASAQDKGTDGINTNADGAYVTSTAGANPTANGEGGTIVYGDINTGPGYHVIGPPSVVQTSAPPPTGEPTPTAAPAPVAMDNAAPAPADESATITTGTDLDGDNYADDAEVDLGLDPNNADTDGDSVADGDELDIYGTDPTAYDTDGDGVSDGEELFGLHTDPLVWEVASGSSDANAETLAQDAGQFETPSNADLYQKSNEVVTAVDGNAASMGPGGASASPGTVTRGAGLLGPDGTDVTNSAPSNVSLSGDTEVISPPADAATTNAISCSSYGSWYDAQVAYEAAGATAGDAAIVQALDPDYDGIACEEGMERWQ
jgi:hypothetical protein